jgi:polar amino acid transport system substrate-binding protein
LRLNLWFYFESNNWASVLPLINSLTVNDITHDISLEINILNLHRRSVNLRCFLKLASYLLLITLSQICLAQATLVFGVNSPGSPPYLYLTKTGTQYQGVIPDVLNKLIQLHPYKIKYIDSFRKRTESFLYKGEVDGFLSSTQWLEFPDKLIHTISVLEHKSYLYSNQPFAEQFTLENAPNLAICARRGYIYPALNPYFDAGKFTRVDSGSQLSMLNMVRINRCNMAVMHEFNAIPILSSADFKANKLYQSDFSTDIVELSIFLRPELIEIKQALDVIIANMKSSGELADSLQKHIEKAL